MSANAQNTYTISQFIAEKNSNDITYSNYSIFERSITNPDLVYAIDNIIYTYLDDLKKLCKTVIVNLHEKAKYIYKPKLLSYDIYGSTELSFVLLAVNGKCNLKEFDLIDNMFYALTPSDMASMLNKIKLAESEYLALNRNNLGIYES